MQRYETLRRRAIVHEWILRSRREQAAMRERQRMSVRPNVHQWHMPGELHCGRGLSAGRSLRLFEGRVHSESIAVAELRAEQALSGQCAMRKCRVLSISVHGRDGMQIDRQPFFGV